MAVQYCVILVTTPDKKTAAKITDILLEERLAACVNQIAQVVSRYRWDDKIEEAAELLLIIKTRATLVPEVVQCVRENHSHSVPEVVALPIADGNKQYMDWIGANTLFKGSDDRGQRRSRTPEREL
ncbi:MAG: divalent-cation tolerance protein CutA [Elusimicrobia bacterium]|nr:divalent-cation tolerance protein CutA [Elusimicrobiota bacterium]